LLISNFKIDGIKALQTHFVKTAFDGYVKNISIMLAVLKLEKNFLRVIILIAILDIPSCDFAFI